MEMCGVVNALVFASFLCLPGMFLEQQMDPGVQATPPSDLYSEAPCELRSLSAYKDIQGNVWGVGEGNLWWFNATNLSWSLLPMPNATAPSEPWRVACVDPKKYVALIGKNSSLILHLPWQHWQFSDTDDVSVGYVDKDATWCVNGSLFATDPLRETLYVLDSEEAHWVVKDNLPVVSSVNWTAPCGLVNVWVGYKNELIMVELFGNHNRVMFTNSTATDWVVMAEKASSYIWPNQSSHGRSLTWKSESEMLWLWKEDKGVAEIWGFSYNNSVWEKGNQKFTSKLPPLDRVLTGWEQDGGLCILKKSPDCNSQYSISTTQCWSESEMIDNPDAEEESEPSATGSTASFTTAQPKSTANVIPKPQQSTKNLNFTSTTRMISEPTTSKTLTSAPIKIKPETEVYPMKPVVTKHQQDIGLKKSDYDLSSVNIIPAKNPNWHQHTSVFGSVIFFGTSITIFGLFGLFWCVRKCVHFPKEALLLRDPPSVRYTAIPDSLTYDSRRPTPATYTVIPDSFA